MADPPQRLNLDEVRRDPRLYQVLLDHGQRGVRVQMLLRAALAIFVVATVLVVPPAVHRTGCDIIAGLYAVWVVVLAQLSRSGGERAVRLIWRALFIDALALGVLAVLAGPAQQSWTSDILVNGFFVIPVLASAQLRPGVAAAVTGPAVAIYLASALAAQNANSEPTSSIILRTAVLAALSVGCVLLSAVQRSRVLTIAGLVADRTRLVTELADLETRARADLAEELHDGVLQYVLAARQDLEDARTRGDADSFDRIDFALRESTSLLRAKVSQLHPAVLKQAGLLRALNDLVRATAERSGLSIELAAEGWDESWRTDVDELVYSAAREFLTNVTKHAGAHSVRVALDRQNGNVRLTVADDGSGIVDGVVEQRLAEGHLGVASQRVRVQAAGGRFSLRSAHPGTVAEVELPVP
jgi:two-component system, NarL family, sensor kinase